jgi:hypothetical protein
LARVYGLTSIKKFRTTQLPSLSLSRRHGRANLGSPHGRGQSDKLCQSIAAFIADPKIAAGIDSKGVGFEQAGI